MHHEILLTLSGCPGDIFTCSRDTGLFELIPDLPFIHPSEVDLINRVVSLGTYYLTIQDFIKKQTSAVLTLTTPTTNEQESPGLYIRALAIGLNQVLGPYRQRLVDVEKECIKDHHLQLSHIQHKFEEYHFLLPSLDATIKHILRHKLHGCHILSLLYDRSSCGIPSVKAAYESLLYTCHGVLYKQLSSWIIHGVLKDDCKEFFIEPVPSVEDKEEEENEESPLQPAYHPRGLSNYQIKPSLLPSYLPMRVAEKILFIGEALQIFLGKESENFVKISSQNNGILSSQSATQLHTHQLTFADLLNDLQRQPLFDLRAFESCCSQIRDTVAEHLWLLLVEESDLIGSLQIMKDFFLLGRGGLYLTFIDIANSFMSLPPLLSTQHDVNVAFRQAMTKLGIEDETLLHQFQLTVPPPPDRKGVLPTAQKPETKIQNSWDQLGLCFKPKWPLHILFTPAVLEKYNSLFKILLAVRRAQLALQHTWYLQMSKRQRTAGLLWQLRVHMAFLIDNLQYYVQVDVLETQFTQLLQKIRSTHDFESIKHAHDVYLTTLQTQLFCLLPAVSRGLCEIMELCHQLHSLVQTMSDPLTLKETAHLDRIAKDFSRQASLLFRILSNVRSLHTAPHLAQLILRLDYNKFFSSHSSLLLYPLSSVKTTSQ